MRAIFSSSLFLLVTTLSASAYTRYVEGWEILTYPADERPVGCMMRGDFRDGTRLAIAVTDQYAWGIGLSNTSWKLRKDGSTDVAAYVDAKLIATGQARHVSANFALLPLNGAEPYKALQRGERLDLQTPYGNLSFSLKGTKKAMFAVLDCVGSLRPQASAPQTSDNKYEVVPLSEATVLLTNLLNAAGIQGWNLEVPKKDDRFVGFRLATGSYGFMRAARGAGTPTADEFANSTIGEWAKLCKGKFFSGKQTIASTDGSVVRKVTTLCQEEGDRKSIGTETTIIRHSNGFMLELAQLSPLGSQAAEQDKQDHQAVVGAALRSR